MGRAAESPGPENGPVRVGDPAPGFRLPGVDGRTGAPIEVELASLRGSPVVVAFYPADDSPVCTAQLNEYTEMIASFDRLDAEVLAISPQSPESHRAFAGSNGGFGFPLLSDEDLSVGRRYGVVGLLDLYRRSTFVLDAEGVVRYLHRFVGPASGTGYRTATTLLEILSAI